MLARFTVGGGNSEITNADNVGQRSFSFRLGDVHQRSEIFTQSAPVHFTRTLDLLRAFLRSRIPGPDPTPNVDEVDAVSAVDPEMLHHASYVAARPLPGSFASTTYWGVHAFPATNLAGETRFIKFKVAPVGGEVSLTESQARAKSTDFLHDDLESRIAARDFRFSVMALLDRPGDPVMDVTIRWPDEDRREAVRLGTIVITGFEANEACDEPVFNPANLTDGIGHPPDEIFAVAPAERRRFLQLVGTASLDAGWQLRRNSEGDYSPDPKAQRFPAIETVAAIKPKQTITGLFDLWWAEAKATGRSRSTHDAYKGAIDRLVKFLGHDDAVRVTDSDMIGFKDHRLKTVSAKTLKDGDLPGIRSVFGWGVDNQRLARNPADAIKVKSEKKIRTRSKGFTDEEAEAIVAACLEYVKKPKEDARTAAAKKWAPLIACYTGCRIAEALQLRKEDNRPGRSISAVSMYGARVLIARVTAWPSGVEPRLR